MKRQFLLEVLLCAVALALGVVLSGCQTTRTPGEANAFSSTASSPAASKPACRFG